MKKNNILRLISLLSIFVLTSCSTMYQPRGFNGGYSEIVTSDDSFFVSFNGNQFTSNETVMKYALRRASELTIHNGYSYFTLISTVDNSNYTGYSNNCVSRTQNIYSHRHPHNPYSNRVITSTTSYGVVCRPAVTVRVKCYKAPPRNIDFINAHFYLRKN